MFCMECNLDISTDFNFAIENNVCPRCGNQIMPDEKLENFLILIDDLRSNVDLTEDQDINEEIIGRISWHLLENYDFSRASVNRKKISKNRKTNLRKRSRVKPRQVVVEEETDDAESDEETQQMLKSAITFSNKRPPTKKSVGTAGVFRRSNESDE